MILFGRHGFRVFASLLLVAGFLLMGSGAWASHDCCGHPSGSSPAEDSGTGASSSDGDCACACCQADTVVSILSVAPFQFDPRWSVEIPGEFAASRVETDIFRPPLA
jgi:hypothetical protein